MIKLVDRKLGLGETITEYLRGAEYTYKIMEVIKPINLRNKEFWLVSVKLVSWRC